MPLDFPLNPLSCSQNLALQIETAALLRIIQVEQPLEPFCDCFQLNVAHLSWSDVQDLAGFVHGDVRSREGAATSTALTGCCIFLGGGGLTVRLGDGTPYYSGTGKDDLGYYTVSLRRSVKSGASTIGEHTIVDRMKVGRK